MVWQSMYGFHTNKSLKGDNMMMTVEEYITENKFEHDLYEQWITFAPNFDFKLEEDDWYEIFSALLDGTYELSRINNEDVENECIVTVPKCDCFYGTYLVEMYTVKYLNNILAENNINIKYAFNNQFNTINKIERR